MRLAMKLLSSLAVLTVIVLGLSALADHRRREELLAMDIEAEGRMAAALRAVVVKVCELAGPGSAKEVIDTLNVATPRRSIRWLAPNEIPQVPGRDLPAEVGARMTSGEPIWVHWPNEAGEPVRYIYIPVAEGGTPLGVIEASESMAPRTAFVRRAHVHTAAVGFVVLALSGALAVVLGRMMVGQPVAALTRNVRALGDGHFGAPLELRRRDELGALATELNTLSTRLAAREQMRHDDRLRTVGQLASGVAHELGTPLSTIAVRARLIASGEVAGTDVAANATAIIDQTDRMTRLVRQLLDYSRRQGGQATSVDLRQATVQAVEMLEPLARTHGVNVTVQAPDQELRVRADAGQLQQVLTNLLLNGIQAMPVGGGLEVSCGHGPASPPPDRGGPVADCYWIRVADEGSGIAPEHLPHVFEPFFTTKEIGHGTGLGLAVAQTIVEEHGGSIGVESTLGRGARFTVYLPPEADAAEVRRAS